VPQNVMLVETDLHMAGYTEERLPQMQRRMLDAAGIPGVTAVGYDHQPGAEWAAGTRMFIPTARPISGRPIRLRMP
jgi:hypothetical protein